MKKLLIGIVYTLLIGLDAPAQAAEYTLPDLDGQSQSLSQYLGKWVVVNYWATWCGTCRKEFPDLTALHEKYRGQDVVVVGINFESIAPQNLKDFIAREKIPYPILRSEPVRRTPLGPVPALPTTYIIDPAGKPVAGEVGLLSRQNLEEYISGQRDKTR